MVDGGAEKEMGKNTRSGNESLTWQQKQME